MFKTALFIVAKGGEHPKRPLTDEGLKTMWLIHNGILFSLFKVWGEGLTTVTSWVDLEDITPSDVSVTEGHSCTAAQVRGI